MCLLLLIGHVSAADIASNRAQLHKIQERIEKAEQDLKNNRRSEIVVSRELAVLQKTLQRIDEKIADLNRKQGEVRKKISEQKKRIESQKKKTRLLIGRLEKRLIALYKEGESGPLKILFSADSPTELVQQYHYMTKILESDQELLSQYKQIYDDQKQQLDELVVLEKHQAGLLEDEEIQRNDAAKGRKLKSRLLARARQNKKKLQSELKQLKENSVRLKQLITKLKGEQKSDKPAVADHFAVGRGKLRWPLEGDVLIGFGTQKDSKLGTYYESNGLEIAAKPGTPVTAVAAGQVVFADYFKGYGNLYILSHPGGYHTLYAQTDRMQKKVGDRVSAGTILGYSGLAGRESIYFEIRSNGSAVNPLSWLYKR